MCTWVKNLTSISGGEFRTRNGNADEMIVIGRVIKAGFICSKVDVTNAKYDAIIDLGIGKRVLRTQIIGPTTHIISFNGGMRSGAQIDDTAPSRAHKYTKDDCDLIIAVNSNDGTCYILPIEDVETMGMTKALSQLGRYKENWQLLVNYPEGQ